MAFAKDVPLREFMHLLPSSELTAMPVSSKSRWGDPIWIIDNPTPGARDNSSRIAWEFGLPDGSRLTDLQHADLLDSLRRVLWSSLVDPRTGKALKPGSVAMFSVGLRTMVRWMVSNRYRSLADLGAAASNEFLTDLPSLMVDAALAPGIEDEDMACAEVEEDSKAVNTTQADDQDVDQALSVSSVYIRTSLWTQIYRQGDALADAGVPHMPEAPFGGKDAYTVAKSISTVANSQIPPLPDEVALPALEAAVRLLGVPADDVIELQTTYFRLRENLKACHGLKRPLAVANIRRVVEGYQFGTIPGESAPWRQPIRTIIRDSAFNFGTTKFNHIQELRSLILSVREAGVLVLQGLVGQRISEVCSLLAGWNDADDLPSCVVRRLSLSGLEELFYVRGELAKTRSTTEEVEWLLGTRPCGSTEVPLPVRALIVLHRIMEPWRELGGISQLLVQFTSGVGLPLLARGVARPTGTALNRAQQTFLFYNVDLSRLPDYNAKGECLMQYRSTRGLCIRTHQWRKTFAHYVLLTRPALLSAVSQHFKHLSIAMTEQGYVVSDPFLRDAMNSAITSATVSFFMEAAQGKRLTGRMGELVENHREELRRLIENDSRASYKNVANWVRVHDIRIFFAEHGKCAMSFDPMQARCHQAAGTSSPFNRAPNFRARSPSLCAGCRAHIVDADHVEFWQHRYVDNARAYAEAEQAGVANEYRVAKERARQAAAMLQHLGVELPTVEACHAA